MKKQLLKLAGTWWFTPLLVAANMIIMYYPYAPYSEEWGIITLLISGLSIQLPLVVDLEIFDGAFSDSVIEDRMGYVPIASLVFYSLHGVNFLLYFLALKSWWKYQPSQTIQYISICFALVFVNIYILGSYNIISEQFDKPFYYTFPCFWNEELFGADGSCS